MVPQSGTGGGSEAPALAPAGALPKDVKLGRYYAVVIGNNTYRDAGYAALKSAASDATAVSSVLEGRYGYQTTVLLNASRLEILSALNDAREKMGANDNVLIYYAGHGARLKSGSMESGYWLPVNADAPPEDRFWVPNEQITGHLGRLAAKRVLVVADSCYSGLLSTDPSYLFLNDKVSYSKEYIKFKLPKRSRLLLSSGGDKPVLDEGRGGNSVFARAFLDELEANQGILSSPELFNRIRKRVEVTAAKNKFVQAPEFKSIKGAGHEVGDFFFVPRQKSG